MYDVKIQGTVYLNSLNHLPFSYEELLSFTKKMPLTFSPLRNDAEKLPVPNFVKTFYGYMMETKRLFTQDEFWERYRTEHKDEIQRLIAGKDEKALMEGIHARCNRAYPSIMRDMSFAYRLQNKDWDVLWNPEVDVDLKTDLVLKKGGTLYGVALYTNTKNGNKWRAKKLTTRTSMPPEFSKIELAIDMAEAESLGSFKAYGPVQIKQLEEAIAKKELEATNT